jgi:uncharacterized repeat protein (TIGR01451 family)
MQASRRSTRSLHSLLAATVLLTVQNTWLFTAPAQADRVDSGGDFICGVPGKDGVGSLSGIINTYYPGAAGTTVAAGSASVPVGTINVAGSTTPISAGDLLLVIQMQDADIDSTDTAAYGNGVGGDVASPTTTTAPAPTAASGVTNLNNSGRYEYVVATGPAVGGAVPISTPLQYTYRNVDATATTPRRVYQVVRVPQYSTATVNGTLTTSAQWNGTSGGIVVLDVAQQLTFNPGSAIDVNGLGFRGGGSNPNGVTNSGGAANNPSLFRSTSAGFNLGVNAPKGEGIAGTPRLVATQPFGFFNLRANTTTTDLGVSNYPNGDEGRGAPGNAGGGGNEHNAGGGGGANAGDGGMGGRSYNGHNGTGKVPPTFDAFVGGFGGKAIAPDFLRLVLGGGGGAGDTNNQARPSGAGGGGGGMVIVRAGSITGSGTINARGADGIDSPAGANPDAGGGGGAGGTVLIATATGTAAGITINAQGGTGGDLNENNTVELDGPGGGGGSGVAYVNGATIVATPGSPGLVVNGQLRNGTSNGATAGLAATGVAPTPTPSTLTTSISGASCLPRPSPLLVNKTVALFTDRDGSGGTTPLASQIPTPGDILEYTIVTTNPTTTAINRIALKDAIPTNTTYVPNSLQISAGANAGAKTDATNDDQAEIAGTQITLRLGVGATATTGGTLTNSSSTVKFRVQINDPILPAGTTQVTNQAIVSSNGYIDQPSNDPATTPADDATITQMGPRLRLVKRITGIKKSTGTSVIAVPGYNDLATDVNDNAIAWPGGSAAYLLGAINTSQVPTTPVATAPGPLAPKDEVEYTIYFLSDGVRSADQVNLCDFIPANQTYVFGTLQQNIGGTITTIADGSGTGPGAGFYNTTAAVPSSCTGTNNARGAVYVTVGNLPNATATPGTSYGFFRFRARVN